jgi:hypothetical protein
MSDTATPIRQFWAACDMVQKAGGNSAGTTGNLVVDQAVHSPKPKAALIPRILTLASRLSRGPKVQKPINPSNPFGSIRSLPIKARATSKKVRKLLHGKAGLSDD